MGNRIVRYFFILIILGPLKVHAGLDPDNFAFDDVMEVYRLCNDAVVTVYADRIQKISSTFREEKVVPSYNRITQPDYDPNSLDEEKVISAFFSVPQSLAGPKFSRIRPIVYGLPYRQDQFSSFEQFSSAVLSTEGANYSLFVDALSCKSPKACALFYAGLQEKLFDEVDLVPDFKEKALSFYEDRGDPKTVELVKRLAPRIRAVQSGRICDFCDNLYAYRPDPLGVARKETSRTRKEILRELYGSEPLVGVCALDRYEILGDMSPTHVRDTREYVGSYIPWMWVLMTLD